MLPQSINLYHLPLSEVFLYIKKEIPHFDYDFSKHVVLLNDENHDQIGVLRLPLHLSINKDLTIVTHDNVVLYLSLESGYAAICIMKGKENIYHTTFSAYMTRKKQGFSQIKYLNKKGKSRAGSRVRLASTIEFFENINTTLAELLESFDIDRIALNCNTTLIPYLYQSKMPCPFDKKDARLYKIPLHIPQSNFSNLDAAVKKLRAPILNYDLKNESYFKVLGEASN